MDYTICSIHFVDALPEGTPWEVDGAAATLQQGFNSIFRKNARSAISRYFELTREMIARSTPDIVGHLDKIKIQNKNNSLFQESESWYRAEVRQTLRQIREAECVLEVNTRGLYQKKTVDPYPSPWVLAQAHELGLPVTLSSDAHHPDQLTCEFTETAAILYEIGFRHLMVWYTGRWQLVSF
ncbi:MAG: histidinol phosphatase, partial [Cyclobacteriaceae bacterium]